MKVTLFVLAAAGLVAAQDLTDQPQCAIPCIKAAIQATGCEDIACLCDPKKQKKLIGILIPCMSKYCSDEDLVKAEKAAASACAAVSANPKSTTVVTGKAEPTETKEPTKIEEPTEKTGKPTKTEEPPEKTEEPAEKPAEKPTKKPTALATATTPVITPSTGRNSTTATRKPTQTVSTTGTGPTNLTGNAGAVPAVAGILAFIAAALAL